MESSVGDDVSGVSLDPKLVRIAREEEMQYVRGKQVWEKVKKSEAHSKQWKVVRTRWIDINNGDESNPKYRSRLVAK